MKRLFSPILFTAAVVALPLAAQTPPTQGWPANRPPDQSAPPAKPPQATQTPPAAKPQATTPPAPGAPPAQQATGTPPPVPLPQWFVEIDVDKKGEVTRAEFLKYRMKSFEELDVNKDGKLTIEEFIKVAEPPFSADVPNGPNLEERRNRARSEFQNLDTNRDGFVERAEAEALVHSEFNQYDTDRDNKVTEPEVRLIVQRSLAREAAERQQIEARRRQGMAAINDFIDMQLREADKLDKNNDGKLSQQEYAVLAGPADGPQAQGLLPYDLRRQLVMRKFQEIDTNKDGQLDRVELTNHAVKQFLEMDTNKDRFLTEEEFKKAQEAETKKMRAVIQAMQPAQPPPAQPRPAPAQPRGGQAQPAPAPQQPQGLAPGLPQGTR
jgi:Ca2+-binding EF-hand superfamily protein